MKDEKHEKSPGTWWGFLSLILHRRDARKTVGFVRNM